jgi:redox-sensitive bicupin YhaK (pirin superfamily)
MSKTLSRVVTTPPASPGFIGEGHTAVEVVRSNEATNDPFVLLMDDRLDIATRRQIGGPHPHAGLETVTLVLEGELADRDEGTLRAGDVLWMTAGRGVIHNEAVETVGRSRILQLWIALPAAERNRAPRFEMIRKDAAPVVRAPGVVARLYSGTSGPLRSTTKNVVPVTMVDIALEPGATFTQDLPAAYNGFVYVIDGEATIGDRSLPAGRVGWFDPGVSDLAIVAGPRGARLVLYAGRPIDEPLLQHGPFVAGSPSEIQAFYRRFRAGEFAFLSSLTSDERQAG